MNIYIGADHRGFEIKKSLVAWLEKNGHQVTDCGNSVNDPKDDYPDFASAVAVKLQEDTAARGIVLCGSGVGVCIAANKHAGVYCGFAVKAEQVKNGTADDMINCLAIAVDSFSEKEIRDLITTYLETTHSNEERHVRRHLKVKRIEEEQGGCGGCGGCCGGCCHE